MQSETFGPIALALLSICVIGACSESATDKPQNPASAQQIAKSNDAAKAPAQAASVVEVSNDLYEFGYTIPAEAMAIAPLKAQLVRARQAAQNGLEGEAKKWKAEADREGFPFNSYATSITWQRVADLPGYLSLSSEIYSYSGGAHGNTGYASLIWDRAKAERSEATALFKSPAALDTALSPVFCTLLNKERGKRRGAPVATGSSDIFDECIKPSEQTVILGSSNGKTFNRIGILIGPYAAGSYAEGVYDLTLPVTPAVIAIVKPQYKSAFSIAK